MTDQKRICAQGMRVCHDCGTDRPCDENCPNWIAPQPIDFSPEEVAAAQHAIMDNPFYHSKFGNNPVAAFGLANSALKAVRRFPAGNAEPVAWRYRDCIDDDAWVYLDHRPDAEHRETEPLYTHPHSQPESDPVLPEELEELLGDKSAFRCADLLLSKFNITRKA